MIYEKQMHHLFQIQKMISLYVDNKRADDECQAMNANRCWYIMRCIFLWRRAVKMGERVLPRCKFEALRVWGQVNYSVCCLGDVYNTAAAHAPGQYSIAHSAAGWGGERTRPCRNFLLNNIKVLVARRKLHPHCQGGAPAAKQQPFSPGLERDARKRFYCMRPRAQISFPLHL